MTICTKEERLYKLIEHSLKAETDKAGKDSMYSNHNVLAGDMNAALIFGDVQRRDSSKDKIRQQFA